MCALTTSLRSSGILGLKWKDIDLEKRRITIRAERSKSGKARVIPINRTLLAEFERLRSLNGGASEFVFLYKAPGTGKLRPVKTVRHAFEGARARAGIENFAFHDFRHTCGSRLIERGADPISVKDLLGHANLKTAEICLHSCFGRMKEALELLNSLPKKRGESPIWGRLFLPSR